MGIRRLKMEKKRNRVVLSLDDELLELLNKTQAMGTKIPTKVTSILRAYFSEGSIIRTELKKVLKIKK